METLIPRLSSICLRHSLQLSRPSPSLPQIPTRQFTTSLAQLLDTDPPTTTLSPLPASPMSSLHEVLRMGTKTSSLTSLDPLSRRAGPLQPPHHLHIYATKHNTHITLTHPNRNPIMSVSAGNIGFRKAARGTYDAGYQLGAYVMGRIQQQGLLGEIQYVEVVMRGFGPGREAVGKILLGSEGRNLRPRVVRVTDATRLKFGGTRSKKPRRLG